MRVCEGGKTIPGHYLNKLKTGSANLSSFHGLLSLCAEYLTSEPVKTVVCPSAFDEGRMRISPAVILKTMVCLWLSILNHLLCVR